MNTFIFHRKQLESSERNIFNPFSLILIWCSRKMFNLQKLNQKMHWLLILYVSTLKLIFLFSTVCCRRLLHKFFVIISANREVPMDVGFGNSKTRNIASAGFGETGIEMRIHAELPRGKRPLLACHTFCKCSIMTSP